MANYTPENCKIPGCRGNWLTKKMDDDIEARLVEIKALTRLNSRQEERVRYFFRNPGGQEFEFFKRIIGLTPAQARRMMAEEYFRRFTPDSSEPKLSLDAVLKYLPPCRSWLKLDDSLKAFVKTRKKFFRLVGMGRDYDTKSAELSRDLEERFDQELDYWDKMRYLLAALPQLREFKDKYADKADRRLPKKDWLFETCDLCWRTLPVNPDLRKKTGRLCFEHDLPATDQVYRRHKRLKAQVDSGYMSILRRLKNEYPRGMSNEVIVVRLQTELTGPESVLPNLVEHLKVVGHDCRPESLLQAFHGPFPKGLASTYREAMDIFFQDALKYPYFFTLDELTLAEAWLTSLQTDRRRKKASVTVPQS